MKSLARMAGFLTLILCVAAPALFAAPPPPDSGYHLLKKVHLGGEGGWDYLKIDSDTRRLYISRGTHVIVVDADTYQVVGDIPDTQGVHGIALAPEFGRGFTSNGRTNTVTIFDLKTLKKLDTFDICLSLPYEESTYVDCGKLAELLIEGIADCLDLSGYSFNGEWIKNLRLYFAEGEENFFEILLGVQTAKSILEERIQIRIFTPTEGP